MITRQYFVLGVLNLIAIGAMADVPITFQAGTPARAADVNQNFADLDSRLNSSLGGLIVSSVIASVTGVASASCPSDRIVLSANCDCDYVNGTRNFGVLFGCQVAGNGGVAGCFAEGTTYNPLLPNPLATVHLRCLSGVTNDGTPIVPGYVPLSSTMMGGNEKTMAPQQDTTLSDELEAAVKMLQDKALDYDAHLRSRNP